MKLIQRLKSRYHATGVASAWHRLAPSLVVSKRFHGATIYMNLRDNIDDLTRSRVELENREMGVNSVLEGTSGDVWDVGANIGLFSVRAAMLGRPCIAFEMSGPACDLMRITRDRNNLDFEIINRAFTVNPTRYHPSVSASAKNVVQVDGQGELHSITYADAEKQFGVPRLLKMDIEGGEAEFFASSDFKQWVTKHQIAWLVETHEWKLGYTPAWHDVPCLALDQQHSLYWSDEAMLVSLRLNR